MHDRKWERQGCQKIQKIRYHIIWDKNNSLAQNDLSTKIDWNSIQNIAKHNNMVLKIGMVKEPEKVLIINFLVKSRSIDGRTNDVINNLINNYKNK